MRTPVRAGCALLLLAVYALLVPVPSASGAPIRVRDDRGKVLRLPGPPKRIISVAPSNTEILYALGLESRIVAVSEYSNYPPAARKKPTVGGVTLNYERILAYKPDLVVAFWDLQKASVQRMDRLGLRVLAIDPKSIRDTMRAIRLVGRATGTTARAERVAREMEAKLNRVKKALKSVRRRPRTLMVIGTEPQLIVAGPGSFMDDALRLAGGVNVASDLRGKFVPLSSEAALARKPEVLITSAPEWAAALARKPGWSTVPAIRSRRYYSPPPDLLERPTPRLADGVLLLAKALHPQAFR